MGKKLFFPSFFSNVIPSTLFDNILLAVFCLFFPRGYLSLYYILNFCIGTVGNFLYTTRD